MTRRVKFVGIVGVMMVMLAGCALVLATREAEQGSAPSDSTRTAINDFFNRYMDPDGRVVRRDQGGDTVSEGQSYALLLAAVSNDRTRFDQVWTWTTSHLQRPDGLLSWRYADGAVADPMSATDADVQSAWALTIAAQRFAPEPYTSDARRLAASILDHESVSAAGQRYLTAGPWATNDPATVNPSYAVPQALVELARVTGDMRWNELVTTSRALDSDLRSRSALPPDWLSLDLTSGRTQPVAAPNDPSSGPAFGLDAARLVAWLSADCDASDRANAAEWATRLDAQPRVQRRELTGEPIGADESAASVAAAATAEVASGNRDRADWLFADARQMDEAHPTYYGAAWLAIGLALAEPQTALTCSTP
ncbi:MAG TPA: glycosyl hydrolase family 8 [Jatrophihabitantaceae bacterium]|nr:glycosyl hydrolase family 8 [Jatrophihabitantaceae bacterium]